MTAPRLVVVGRGAPERGGIPTFLDTLVRGQGALGYDVVLVNLTPAHGSRGGRASAANALRTLTDARRVFRTARSGDIVHVHSALAPTVTGLRAGLLLRAARARRARTVVHAHGGLLATRRSTRTSRFLLRRSLAAADLVIAVSAGVRRALIEAGVRPGRLRQLRNGVAADRFLAAPASHHPPRVLFVGGLTARKGVLDLLAASSALQERGVDHEVWLVGGVPDEGTDARREVLTALPAHALAHGPVAPEEMPAVYAQADVFCLPSWWEAMPLTVLEAQAAGLPVVATDVGDVREMVRDGVTGRVVPPRDRDALVEALAELLTQPERRAAMGRQARRHVRNNFDQTRVLRGLSEILEEVRDR